MKGKKVCKYCKNLITPDEKAVLLMTFKGNKNLEKVYFHFKCYIEWFNKSLENKAIDIYSDTMKKIIPEVAALIDNEEETTKSQIQEVGIS